MILVVDNYDSFTFNLVQYLGELGADVVVHRNDQITVDEILAMRPRGVLVSPGPGNPDEAGVSLDVVARVGPVVPVLGVCLGHQCIGQTFGGQVVRASRLMHGRTSPILHDGQGLFEGIPSPFTATRYHSLVVDPATVPDALVVTAWTAEGEIMGLRHRTLPIRGVQFHPESFLTEHGHTLLGNWLRTLEAREAAA